MKKQLLLIVMLLSVAASAFAVEVEINGLWYYVVTNTKEAQVIQYKNNVKYADNIVIPEAVVYEGTTYSVTSIGESAFYSCFGLTSVTIPNSVTSIGEKAFEGCKYLTSVTIPNSVTSIGSWAFDNCHSLTSVTIPNSVTSIGNGAFYNCSKLNTVTIGNSVTSIGSDAFAVCSSLTSVTIGNSVTKIGVQAFYDCSKLNTVTIPNSVTSIGKEAFFNCLTLTSVTIPNSVTSIGDKAFDKCSGLTAIDVEAGNTKYDSRNNCNAIIETSSNTLIAGCKNTIIPNSVTSIGDHAFYGCSKLNIVTIPNSVTSIGKEAFYGCSKLTSVTCYAGNVPSTSSDAFMDSNISNATLQVPTASIKAYKTTEPWSNFKEIKGIDSDLPKCATPTIAIVGGKLMFDCATDGVKFIADYSYHGGSTIECGEVVLSGKTVCHVTVYATKEGYENSETVTYDMELSVGKKGDTNGDGKVDVEDVVETVNIILGE